MPHRLALVLVLAAVLVTPALRVRLEVPTARPDCTPAARGVPPRHHLGCAADGGPDRALAADERLALGLPLDPNTAGVRELAFVPGLSRRLAAEIVQDRERNGRYRHVSDLIRVRGIGPRKLAAAAPHLAVVAP
jgi:competence protein ComEA